MAEEEAVAEAALEEEDAAAEEAGAELAADVNPEEVAEIEEQLEEQEGAEPILPDDGGAAEMTAEAEAAVAAAGQDDGEESEEDEDGIEVEEHLKDAVEGSLRLKRLLSREDGDDQPKKKKRKTQDSAMQMKAKALLAKWSLSQDCVAKHVLDSMTGEELDEVMKSSYTPDRFNMWKSPSELIAKFINDLRERKMVGGSGIDVISAFKHRWKLNLEQEKQLRKLNHKDLRFVLNNYDGTAPLEEVIAEAAADAPEENSTASALPESPGSTTMSRFSRLELIDPLADCAVFGDANLTFSLKLAKHRKALGHVGRVIATTFEEVDTLRERYKEVDDSIKILEDHYAEVYHGVDCTRIAIDTRFKDMEGSLGAVYYNFPHSGAIQGFFDGHPIVNWRHENLMRLFFRALRSFVKPGGIVKVASNMGAVGVRYSYIVGSAIENEFLHLETMPFLEWHLHRYGRSYGDKRDVYKRPDATNNQSYNAQRAEMDMVYVFCFQPSGSPIGKQTVRLPPSLKTLNACCDGPFKSLQGPAKANLAMQLHKRFVTEVSGTHVG